MDVLTEDSGSDIEVLEPQVLKYRYRRQELRLIKALSECADTHKIPRKWEHFQIFVKNTFKFSVSPRLVRSVWVQLHACFEHANNTSSCDLVEICDEEEDKEIVKKQTGFLRNAREIIHEELILDNKRGKPSDEQPSDYIEICDEEDKEIVKQQNECFSNPREIIHEELKLNLGKSSNEQPSDYIEISDEEEVKPVVKQDELLIMNGGVIHTELKPNIKGEKFNNGQSFSYVEISDEELKPNIKEEKFNNGQSFSYVEISDEELKPNIKEEKFNNGQSFSYVEISDEELKPDIKGGKFNNGQLFSYVEIVDGEETTNKNYMESNHIIENSDPTPNKMPKGRLSAPNGRKRNYTSRRSLPNKMTEAEAEALRERLLLDKIIELELPQVLKGFMEKNNIVKSCAKKKRKTKTAVDNRESINGTSSNACISVSEMV
ncbi:uncharacterized protein [Halyomorpha halys]|uniref:uncharacterized protein n=1 Tax=Halyomorpha halys TaxID=286706 RepID=UPI0006D4E273